MGLSAAMEGTMRLSTKLTLAMSLVAGVLYVSVRTAAADQIGFAVDNTLNLFSVDLTTATATPIGYTGQFLEGLAISPTGSLFGTDAYGSLYSVSPTTGATTLIGNTGLGDIEGLAFNGTTLIGTNFSNLGGQTTVSAINTSTAAPTTITSFSQGPVRAMAVVNPTTVDVASDSPVSQSLVQVNLLTGTNLDLGQLPSNGLAVTGSDLISALNFGTDGVLYALDALGNEFTISSNGAGTLVGNTGDQQWLDLAMASTALDPPAPVPEPSSMALLLVAALGLIGVRAWQRSAGSTQS
jgi:PEP-CTERM motif